ncbi:MAG: [FeFe] hydrogenase H-cluster maturation GTPase HydF [Bacillota bacterium]|nr:[FeFe] hydrogenase H-cluster maturation GTPase HydF [Bacillota bacterium]
MSLNDTPLANRIHIGIFGRRNAGKSSLINALTGQSLAIVSDVAGTTTDPVQKAMELLPLGPVVLIDTPGLDDVGELGQMRVEKAYQVLRKTEIAVVVVDGTEEITEADERILSQIRERNIPFVIVKNKMDLMDTEEAEADGEATISVSAHTGQNIHALKEMLGGLAVKAAQNRPIVRDLLQPMDFVVLVVPIDSAAPKGRLILPQQQTIRDILEAGAVPVVTRDHELRDTLSTLGKQPRMVITDSQVFDAVSETVPEEIPLTSFSILMARHKGDLEQNVSGAAALKRLKDGDHVLISEGCTHHRQCEDIGTVKLPRWIREYTQKDITFHFSSGTEFPADLSQYALIIHCGGCTLNEREMKYRLQCAAEQGIPMTNYGICIAFLKGILERSVKPLGIF